MQGDRDFVHVPRVPCVQSADTTDSGAHPSGLIAHAQAHALGTHPSAANQRSGSSCQPDANAAHDDTRYDHSGSGAGAAGSGAGSGAAAATDSVSVQHTQSTVSSGAAEAPQTVIATRPATIPELGQPREEAVALRSLAGMQASPEPSTSSSPTRRPGTGFVGGSSPPGRRHSEPSQMRRAKRHKHVVSRTYVPPPPPIQRRASDGAVGVGKLSRRMSGSPQKRVLGYSRSGQMPAASGMLPPKPLVVYVYTA